MAQTPPPSITAAPTPAPVRNDRTTFSARVDAFVTWLIAAVSQFYALAANVYGNAVDCYNNAVVAALAASGAAAAQAAAEAAAGATVWVSGTTYTIGNVRWSPLDFQSYRRKTNGAGTTDPSLPESATDWEKIGASVAWTTISAAHTATAGEALFCDTSAGAFPLTMPTNPSVNDRVLIAGSFSINNLTIDWAGKNHFDLTAAADPTTTVSKNNQAFALTYFGGTTGWGFGL